MPQVRDAHSAQQLDTIRKEDAILKQKERAEQKPETLEKYHLCDFRIDRYKTTDLRGMFEITQNVYKDGKKVAIKKVIEGVWFEQAIDAMEKALRWRVYNMK